MRVGWRPTLYLWPVPETARFRHPGTSIPDASVSPHQQKKSQKRSPPGGSNALRLLLEPAVGARTSKKYTFTCAACVGGRYMSVSYLPTYLCPKPALSAACGRADLSLRRATQISHRNLWGGSMGAWRRIDARTIPHRTELSLIFIPACMRIPLSNPHTCTMLIS